MWQASKTRRQGRAGAAEEPQNKMGPRERTVSSEPEEEEALAPTAARRGLTPPPLPRSRPPWASELHAAHYTAQAGQRLHRTCQGAAAAGSHDAGATRGRDQAWAEATLLPKNLLTSRGDGA